NDNHLMAKNQSQNVLRTLRKQRNLTQVEVAVAVGVSRSHLANAERGGDNLGRDALMALADFYQVSLDVLAQRVGSVSAEKASANNEKEALLLSLYRGMRPKEADGLLTMLLSRLDTEKN
ncbi:MAG: helix-turn-helix transcriptional regulator, partial [Acidocella sp.]|nr:helix-turn-helix transcriptional regulator [Acidocella sp.]